MFQAVWKWPNDKNLRKSPPADPQCRLIHLNRKTSRILSLKLIPIPCVLVLNSALLRSSAVGLAGAFLKSDSSQAAVAPINELGLVMSDVVIP